MLVLTDAIFKWKLSGYRTLSWALCPIEICCGVVSAKLNDYVLMSGKVPVPLSAHSATLATIVDWNRPRSPCILTTALDRIETTPWCSTLCGMFWHDCITPSLWLLTTRNLLLQHATFWKIDIISLSDLKQIVLSLSVVNRYQIVCSHDWRDDYSRERLGGLSVIEVPNGTTTSTLAPQAYLYCSYTWELQNINIFWKTMEAKPVDLPLLIWPARLHQQYLFERIQKLCHEDIRDLCFPIHQELQYQQ